MRAIEINQDLDLAKTAFTSSMSLRSKGMAGLFLKVKTDLKATGTITDGVPVPTSFRMAVTDRRYAVTWSKDDKPVAMRQPELSERKAAAVEQALDGPVSDPLTLMLRQGFAGREKVCSGVERVYNGKEVTEYSFERVRDEAFGQRDGSVYRGPVVRCRLTYRLIAGFSRKAMAKNWTEPVVITFWAAPVETSASANPVMLVVAFSGRFDNRPFSAFLNAATISGHPLNPASLASR